MMITPLTDGIYNDMIEYIAIYRNLSRDI